MQIKQWLAGTVELKIVCADPQSVLNLLLQKGVIIERVRWIDDLTVELSVPRSAFRIIKQIEKKTQCEVIVNSMKGLGSYIDRLTKRMAMVLGLIIFLALSLYVQNHILFVEVSGNSVIPDRKIIDHAGRFGLHFGTHRKSIRSEQIKNMLLENIPELQWVGINTAGCVAMINVRERTNTEGQTVSDYSPASVIAARDGTICEVTASKGTILCQVGQQVTAGQTLISGMNKCGEIMLMTRAEGEVFATTERALVIKTIPATMKRTQLQHSQIRIRIILGKNLINLFKDSGILDSSCVKIGTRYDLRLPKGHVLPVSLYCESISAYSIDSVNQGDEQYRWLLQQGAAYIADQMIAGEIINSTFELFSDQTVIEYRVNYSCKEMIGQIKKEELFCLYGKNS